MARFPKRIYKFSKKYFYFIIKNSVMSAKPNLWFKNIERAQLSRAISRSIKLMSLVFTHTQFRLHIVYSLQILEKIFLVL